MGRAAPNQDRIVAQNRRASFDYELGAHYEAGLSLLGSEVRMLRDGFCNLTDAWCRLERGEAFVEGVEIPPLPNAAFAHEPKRKRKLLLHARELEEIARAVERDGMTVIATKVYFKGGRAKIELALAKGRKKADKREHERERTAEREARDAMGRAAKAYRGGRER